MVKKFEKIIKGKTIVVTGGTGSFGKYISGELVKYAPKEIRIFSRDEDKQNSMQHDFQDIKFVRFIIGDVRDKDSVQKGLKNADIVLHAAALKQIPSTEHNIIQAVKTNVVGAQNIVDVCLEEGVEKVLAISTDKAAEPINVMGMTKAIQERIFTLGNKYKDGSRTRFACVRYGNVINSRGSVIPLFLQQINEKKPITLTDLRMTRFILTLEEATNLVFTALEKMVGGEIFVPKIKAIKISDLAEIMKKELKADKSKIVEVGIRPGEKLHETLISPTESVRSVEENFYYLILPQIDISQIGYSYKVNLYDKEKVFRYSSDMSPLMTRQEIVKILKKEKII
ncbi:MAG: polysaccharide biosynthesis protein [Candidatus Levybacteria bacterium]|nr:polysaccharide biosynthesis protein [Candidatus Levybacteria bacterium]